MKMSNAVRKVFKGLVGKTVVGFVFDPDAGFSGLKFDDGTIAWVLQDPEGNGPGHLEINEG